MRMILARRAGVLACVALLAGLCGCLVNQYRCDPLVVETSGCGPRAGCPAEDERLLTDLGGFGFRPQSVLKRTGFKVEDLPYLKHFRAKVGIPLPEVDTFAVVCFDAEKRALLVRTLGDVNQGNVMMACEAGDLMPTQQPSKCAPKVYTGKSGLAVHFPSPRVALITDSPATMANCLKQLPALTEHLDKAREVDVSLWGRAVVMKKPESRSCYRALGSLFLPGVHTAAKVAPPKAEDESTIHFLELPLPRHAKAVRSTINLGPAASVAFDIDFADEESAKAGKEDVADLLDLGRGMLISVTAQLRLARHTPGLFGEPDEQLKAVGKNCLDLLSRIARSMQDVKVEAKGKQVTASLRVPLKPEDRAASTTLFAEIDPKIVCGEQAWPGLFFDRKLGTLPVVPVVADQPPPPLPTAPPLPPRSDCLPPPPPPPAATWTLTVANVLKDGNALVFTIDPKGDLTFVAKVPPGEAVDLPAEKGQRWAATFMNEPHRALHTVSADKQVLLIRPAPVPLPTTSAGSSSLSR